jgi:hypothetical protein
MAADDDLDALEAQLEDYDDDDDDDDISPLKRVWKKFKILIVVGVAFLIFIPVILVSVGGSDSDKPKLVIVPELAPEPGKQVKVLPEQPGGEQVGDQDKGVFNVVTEGKNAGKIAITAPPEDPKSPPADAKAPDGAETPIAMVPEGAEKTPKDGKNAEGTMMPPPMPPEKDSDAALPAPPTPGAPTSGEGKTAENILPVPPADEKTPKAMQPEKPAEVAVQPVQPAPTAPQPAAPANNNQIAVVIPKASTTAVAVAPPPPPPPGDTKVTPMRTMAGVYRVQVAAARSETAAKTLWDKQVKKHPDVLGKLPLTVQTAVIQDRGTFYRVQGGAFGDREAADSVCRKLKSRGQDCIVVRP